MEKRAQKNLEFSTQYKNTFLSISSISSISLPPPPLSFNFFSGQTNGTIAGPQELFGISAQVV